MIQIPDSALTAAVETGKNLGSWGNAGVGLGSVLLAQIAAVKSFPWPKKLRWGIALLAGGAGGAGILGDPVAGVISSAVIGYGWGMLKSTAQWVSGGMKWLD